VTTYRKKPVEVEAWDVGWLLRLADHSPHFIPQPVMAAYTADPPTVTFHRTHLLVETLEGTMRAEPDDMLIQGIAGELYPCKPDIFAATYEEAS
jgi:hypothetical protein